MKKMYSIILCLFLSFFFVGCGKDDNNSSTQNAEKENDFAILSNPIIDQSDYYEDIIISENGAEFYVLEKLEDKIKIEFIIKNGHGNLITSVELYDSLIDENVTIKGSELMTHSYYHSEYQVYVTKITLSVSLREFTLDKYYATYDIKSINYWDFESAKNVNQKIKQDDLSRLKVGVDIDETRLFIKDGFLYEIESDDEVNLLEIKYDVYGKVLNFPSKINVKNYDGELKEYTLTSVGGYSEYFDVSSAKEIHIPKSIKTIRTEDSGGFDGTRIIYEGTIAEWNQIEIDVEHGYYNDHVSNNKLVSVVVYNGETGSSFELTSSNRNNIYMVELPKAKKITIDSSISYLSYLKITSPVLEGIVFEEGITDVTRTVFFDFPDTLKYWILPSTIEDFDCYNFEYSNDCEMNIYMNSPSLGDAYSSLDWKNSLLFEKFKIYFSNEWKLENGIPVPLIQK